MNKGRVIAVDSIPGTYYLQNLANPNQKISTIVNQGRHERANFSKDMRQLNIMFGNMSSNGPGPGAYEQKSEFDKLVEQNRIQKKKQG